MNTSFLRVQMPCRSRHVDAACPTRPSLLGLSEEFIVALGRVGSCGQGRGSPLAVVVKRHTGPCMCVKAGL